MKAEIEAKFLNQNHEVIREMLERAGGVRTQPMRLMKRAIFHFPGAVAKEAFVRVRDEGDKVTLTYKQFALFSVDGAREIETIVGSFDDTVAILTEAGLTCKSVQETKRETWRFDDVEVMLDEWPWLNPFIEVEGPSATSLEAVATLLGLQWSDAVFGGIMAAYQLQYPHLGADANIANQPDVRFGVPLPDMLRR